MAVLYLDTDHTVRLAGLADQDGQAVTGASVKADLLDKNYQPANLAPFPLTLTDAGAGDYTAQISDMTGLSLGTKYQVRYVAEKNTIKRTWFDELEVQRGKF